MACTVVAAVLLTLWRSAIPAEENHQFSAAATVASSIFVGLSAIGLTFALLSVYWHLKGYAALVQPGQWLLLQNYLVDLAQLLFGLLLLSKLRVTGPWGKSFALWTQEDKFFAVVSALYLIVVYLNRAAPALFYAWCAWRVADTRPWRIFFSLHAIIGLLGVVPLYYFSTPGSSIFQVRHAATLVTNIAMLSLLVWIAATEYRRQQRYWTHWLGVGLCVATTVLEFASVVMNWLGWY
jgi:hypothetical protein